MEKDINTKIDILTQVIEKLGHKVRVVKDGDSYKLYFDDELAQVVTGVDEGLELILTQMAGIIRGITSELVKKTLPAIISLN